MLKQVLDLSPQISGTAAFRRLCVETTKTIPITRQTEQPPSGGCVLKLNFLFFLAVLWPAAFRRLCVETKNTLDCCLILDGSRLQAAVC